MVCLKWLVKDEAGADWERVWDLEVAPDKWMAYDVQTWGQQYLELFL